MQPDLYSLNHQTERKGDHRWNARPRPDSVLELLTTHKKTPSAEGV